MNTEWFYIVGAFSFVVFLSLITREWNTVRKSLKELLPLWKVDFQEGNFIMEFLAWGAIVLIVSILLGWHGLDPGCCRGY